MSAQSFVLISGLVAICIENERAERLNLVQFLEDFAVLKADKMPFRQLITTPHSL